ncbi:MAG: MBL fold metallo-hydrolase, partial [Pseudomonadota bacterium]
MTASARADLPACELSARFTGVGNAGNRELGSAALVIERNEAPLLLIDCGPDTLDTFADHYVANRQTGQDQALPPALFITHTHLDHVGG